MPRPRTPKPSTRSRDGSGEDSDATVDSASSIQTRRTRKRPALATREGTQDQSDSQSAFCSCEQGSSAATGIDSAERHAQPTHHRHDERRTNSNAAQSEHHATLPPFETPNQARDRLALIQAPTSDITNSTRSATEAHPHRSARSSLRNLGLHLPTGQASRNSNWRSTSVTTSLSDHSSSTRHVDCATSENPRDSTDALMTPIPSSSQHGDPHALSGIAESLALRSRHPPSQPQAPSAPLSTTPMVRTRSNMSPPRPTRSLPRRQASARTQTRPLLSSSNSSSSSYALRSRSTSSSNILAPSSSAGNILASTQNSRQNSVASCTPLGAGFDPSSFNQPSGMSTPRTPLAEIPLWLADMRSESRRSSTSSASFVDREDFLSASRPVSSRHARTLSTSSSGPSSPGASRNGSTSPVTPFRRSLRGRRPRQSDENARMSPSPSYSGEYDALPSPSSASARGEMVPVDDATDPNASLSSNMIHLGTSSPSTPSVQLQPHSPAMSTRSRTLNRAGSVRNRRMTNPLNTPVSVELAALPFEMTGSQNPGLRAAILQASPPLHQGHTRNNEEIRSSSLLERRAASAAAAVAQGSSHAVTRAASRPSSRTSSPAQGTRASRRRSTATEDQMSSSMDSGVLGGRPPNLPPLQIPHLTRDAGLMLSHVPTSVLMVPDHVSEAPIIVTVDDRLAVQNEPVSPSAFSEMTSMTQGSTASESTNSAGGMPATPSSSTSPLDPFSHAIINDTLLLEARPSSQVLRTRGTLNVDGDSTPGLDSGDTSSNRVLRQTTSQRKHPSASRDVNSGEDVLGMQLRPRP